MTTSLNWAGTPTGSEPRRPSAQSRAGRGRAHPVQPAHAGATGRKTAAQAPRVEAPQTAIPSSTAAEGFSLGTAIQCGRWRACWAAIGIPTQFRADAGPVARQLAPVTAPAASAYLPDTPLSNGGSGLAREGGLPVNTVDRVHIRYLGNGHLGFRPDGGSLLKAQSKV